MKKDSKWSVLVYAAEILLVIAAIILVVKLVPDLRPKPSPNESSQTAESGSAPEESKASDSDAEPETPAESGGAEDGQGGWEHGRDGSGGYGKKDHKTGQGTAETECLEETEAPYVPPVMIIASDLHYMSPTMTDRGEVFDQYLENSDGRAVPYLDQITDAFLEEVAAKKPSVLILSGDISQDGEKVNHGELARKLRRLQAAGVPVAVIPGNHDINNPNACTYYGDAMVPTEAVDADGFYDIYHEFGYDQAMERDENSLSYMYRVDEKYWLMMLDSCIYNPENEVGGRIRKDTLKWMETWLEKAKEEHVTVIPVAHHNLLNESALYTEECTLENSREVIDLLEKYKLPIYISGHMHLQRVKKNVNDPLSEGKYGIYEIVSSSLPISPFQYGILNWLEDGSLKYKTAVVNVSSWAEKRGSDDENLLNFSEYGEQVLKNVISNQMYLSVFSIPKDRRQDMADLYGDINSAYCSGTKIDATAVKKEQTYFYWKRYLGDTEWFDRLTAMLKDTKRDHNSLYLTAGKDFPVPETEESKENAE